MTSSTLSEVTSLFKKEEFSNEFGFPNSGNSGNSEEWLAIEGNISYFSNNFERIAAKAGVTFLAFGNGSPDLFSTFTAMSHESGSLAIGELIGAASFITSIVAGSMAVITPFRVTKVPFMRNVIFFLLAIIITLSIIWDGMIYLWESIVLVAFYILYVSVVFIGSWWTENQKKMKWQEQKARDEYNQNLRVNVDTDNQGVTIEDDYDNQEYEYDSYHETDPLLPEGERHVPDYSNRTVTPPPISMTNLATHSHHEGQNQFKPASVISRQPARGTRPSLFGAIEFRDIVNSLKLDSSARALGVLGRNYTSDLYNPYNSRPRSRTLPHSRTINNPSRRRSWASSNYIIEEYPDTSYYGNLSDHVINAGSSSNPTNTLQVPNLLTHDQESDTQLSISPLNISDNSHPENQPQFISDVNSLRSSPRSTPTHSHSRSPNLSPLLSPIVSPSLLPVTNLSSLSSFKITILSLLNKFQILFFPYLEGFSNKSLFAKFIALMACPATFLLTLTLPVVYEDDIIGIQDEVIIPSPDENVKSIGWNRTLTAIQLFFAPLFTSVVLFGDTKSIIYSLIIGITLSLLCIIFAHENEPPLFYSSLCFMGFGVAMVWIFLIANEVVSLLESFGLIIGVSEAILGLTIFAMGNSLGDFVANITIAKMGLPMMAISACFGSPMLNILLGIGLSGTYMTAKTGLPYKIDTGPTLFISAIGLLISLLSTLRIIYRFPSSNTQTCLIPKILSMGVNSENDPVSSDITLIEHPIFSRHLIITQDCM
ncbi:4866_t:CDS:10 [Diversispora eburnea]|uniref:4866_t:CDS:1 n=1 Tax=Diversispora eburnea TaxID=1213867 RepID=A0A9N8ZVG0_9GLOM|nr:4866_t:CDS:10 [Diversispora eburnea]